MSTVTLGGARLTADTFDPEPFDAASLGVVDLYLDAPGLIPLNAAAGSGGNAGHELRVSVYTADRTIIAHLPDRKGVQGLVERNGLGSGAIEIHQYADTLLTHPDLWDDNNQVTVWLGAVPILTWIMEEWAYSTNDDGSRSFNRVGRGNLSVLENAILYPEQALRRNTSDDRYFNFGSADGPWRKPAEWRTPRGVKYRKSHRFAKPFGWPDNRCQWIWWKSPERASKIGPAYFRAEFTLDERTRVRFWLAGDDNALLMLDGEPILRQKDDHWRKPKAITRVLTAGTHNVAARVENLGDTDDDAALDSYIIGGGGGPSLDSGIVVGPRRAGFLFLAASVTKKNKIRDVLLRSNTTRWTVRKELSEAPGWFPATVLQAFVLEAQARGVLGFSSITIGFTAGKDSDKRPWIRRIAQSYRMASRGLDLMQQVVERGVDVAMTPEGELRAWVNRGADRSSVVALNEYTDATGRGTASGIINTVLVKSRRGWTEHIEEPSLGLYGRRESGVSAGGASDVGDARSQANAVFDETAYPDPSYSLTTTSLRGPQPFLDYDLCDILTVPTQQGRGKARVLAIAFTESDAGDVEWSHTMEGL